MTERTRVTTPDGVTLEFEQLGMPLDLIRMDVESWALAAHVGVERERYARAHGLQHTASGDNRKGHHMGGALAEAIVASALGDGVRWLASIGVSHEGDLVAPFGPIEVRSSPKHNADLVIRPSDEPDRPYVLVVGTDVDWYGEWATMRCPGWIMGRDAQRENWWRRAYVGDKRPPAYFVPPSYLSPLSSLKRWTEGKGS